MFTRTTAIYPKDQGITYTILGLNEEAGEVAGKLKKSIRDGWLQERFTTEAIKELGDVLWYVARAADELGFTLEQVADENVAKLSSRKDRDMLSGSGDNR